ncbi:hypothetical protein [Cellulomonas sp. P5_E12]
MDTPRGSGEFEHADELARLRRRAFGPDADIVGDAAAQARLAELEAAQRRQATPVGDTATGAPAPIPERVPVTETVEGSRSAPTSVRQPVGGVFAAHERAGTSVIEQDTAEGSTAADSINRAPAAPWWRRRSSIVAGVIATLALNVAVTASISQLLADQSTPIPAETATEETPPVPDGQGGGYYVPAPDHMLALKSDGAAADQPHDPGGKLDALGISPGELKRYEDFYGPEPWDINVWSGESRYGMTCLLVAVAGQPISDGGRAAEGLFPQKPRHHRRHHGDRESHPIGAQGRPHRRLRVRGWR